MAELKILMVCLGNICRSPVAEGVMKHIADSRGLNWTIDSAGTSGFHNGEAPDRRSQKNALKNGIDISGQRSRKFTTKDFERFDVIYVMDCSNRRDVLSMTYVPAHRAKVKLLLDVLNPGNDLEVPDPWYGGEQGFEDVFQLVKRACEKIADELSSS